MTRAEDTSGENPGSGPALLDGWRLLWRSKRLWVALWLLHLGVGAVLAGIFAGVWDDVLGRSLAAERLGGPETAGVLVDLINHHGQALSRLFTPVGLGGTGPLGSALIVLGWAWLGAVLAGGAVAQLARVAGGRGIALPEGLDGERVPRPPFLGSFLWDCGWHLARMTRLLALHLAVLAVSLVGTLFLTGLVVLAPLGPAPAPDDQSRALLAVPVALVAVFLFLGLVHDYARIRVVREQRRSVVLAWWKGLRFVFRRLLRAAGLQVVFLALVAAISVGWWLWGPAADAGLVALALAPPAWLLLRAGVRVWWLGAELSLFDRAL